MLRNALVIVFAAGILFSGMLSPVNAANAARVNAAIAARQAATAQAAKKHHRHHHHKKGPTGQVLPAIK